MNEDTWHWCHGIVDEHGKMHVHMIKLRPITCGDSCNLKQLWDVNATWRGEIFDEVQEQCGKTEGNWRRCGSCVDFRFVRKLRAVFVWCGDNFDKWGQLTCGTPYRALKLKTSKFHDKTTATHLRKIQTCNTYDWQHLHIAINGQNQLGSIHLRIGLW